MNFTDRQREQIKMFHPLFEALNPNKKLGICPWCHSEKNRIREADCVVWFTYEDGDYLRYGRYQCEECDGYFEVVPEHTFNGQPCGIKFIT